MFTSSVLTLMVADFDEALRFYTETLGFPLQFRAENHWAQVQGPGVILGIHPAGADSPKPGQTGSFSLGLRVADIAAAQAELAAKGIQFAPLVDDGNVKIAYFTDPEGLALYLYETKYG